MKKGNLFISGLTVSFTCIAIAVLGSIAYASSDKSLDLERSSFQSVSISNASTTVDLTDSFTIESWIKLESQPDNTYRYYSILTQWSTASRGVIFTYNYYNGSTAIRMELQNSTNTGSVERFIPYTLDNDVWYHIAVAYNSAAGTVDVYIDGKHVGTMTGLPLGLHSSTAPIIVGHDANYGTASAFDGKIDGLRVWDNVRSELEIRANMFTEITSDPDLQASWQFEGDYSDSSGNGNTLTPRNSPVFSTEPAQKLFSL